MRRLSAVFALLALIVNGAPTGKASPAQGSERGHPVLQLGANKIEVDHGRPSLRGRNPEEMIKPGQAWRMGSDDPTTLTTQASLKFGDKVITAGKYILQAKLVEPQNWHLLIESESGSLSAEVPLTLQRLDKPVEYLTIALEKQDQGGRLVVQWGKLALATEFQPAATTASADGADPWNELSSFHSLMSQTFHPLEEGNLTPIRTRAA